MRGSHSLYCMRWCRESVGAKKKRVLHDRQRKKEICYTWVFFSLHNSHSTFLRTCTHIRWSLHKLCRVNKQQQFIFLGNQWPAQFSFEFNFVTTLQFLLPDQHMEGSRSLSMCEPKLMFAENKEDKSITCRLYFWETLGFIYFYFEYPKSLHFPPQTWSENDSHVGKPISAGDGAHIQYEFIGGTWND